MKLNRDVIIQSIISYQEYFLKVLDFINLNDGNPEIPVNIFSRLYHEGICVKAEERGDINATLHLSTESLITNGIFLQHDKHSGMLVLEPIIINLLSFIDVKRSKELNRADFENMRENLETSVRIVMAQELGAQEYKDALSAFWNCMNRILSEIRENTERLKVKVDDIAVEYTNFESSMNASDVVALYDKVRHLYHRYVLPCFDFLSHGKQLVAKESFSHAVDQLIAWHEGRGAEYTAIAQRILFSKTKISSYYKDVSEHENKLRQYSNTLESERRTFIAIESAFSTLMEEVATLRHGKRKGFKLSNDANFFKLFHALDGMESFKHKFSSKLHYEPGRTVRRLVQYVELLDTKSLPKKRSAELKAVPAQINLTEQRKEHIAKLVDDMSFSGDIHDIHAYLHEQLQSVLPDYSLVDVLYGLECFIPIFASQCSWSEDTKGRIEDGKYYFNYMIMDLKGSHHV